MRRIRVIPALLIHEGGLVKSIKFKNYQYIGDPINAVKIFNEKEVDEIAIIDIDASRDKRSPKMQMITDIVSEAFMPVAYGGGITNISEIEELLFRGVEKVLINKSATQQPGLITEAARRFGSQSIVVSIDVKKTLFKGKKVFTDNGKKSSAFSPAQFAKQMEESGAGEILLNAIEKDGTYEGYDLELIEEVAQAVQVPVIAIGGASSVEDFELAVKSGASAVAAGSMFVFQRPHNAVLISYPSQKDLMEKLYSKV